MSARNRFRSLRWSNLSLRLKILTVMAVPTVALMVSSASFLIVSRTENPRRERRRPCSHRPVRDVVAYLTKPLDVLSSRARWSGPERREHGMTERRFLHAKILVVDDEPAKASVITSP